MSLNWRDRMLDEATCYKLVGHMLDRRIKATRLHRILMDEEPAVYRVEDLLAVERFAANAIHRAARK